MDRRPGVRGKFVAAHITQMYLVEFEDGSQDGQERRLLTLDEELPRGIQTGKCNPNTHMFTAHMLLQGIRHEFDGIFEEKEIIQESKRQRVINS
ncbi:hypothetical protein INR49_009013, partial [Caranx melampygus]